MKEEYTIESLGVEVGRMNHAIETLANSVKSLADQHKDFWNAINELRTNQAARSGIDPRFLLSIVSVILVVIGMVSAGVSTTVGLIGARISAEEQNARLRETHATEREMLAAISSVHSRLSVLETKGETSWGAVVRNP